MIYAVIDEVLQKGTFTRGGSIFDVGLDLIGVLTAAVIIFLMHKMKTMKYTHVTI